MWDDPEAGVTPMANTHQSTVKDIAVIGIDIDKEVFHCERALRRERLSYAFANISVGRVHREAVGRPDRQKSVRNI